MSLSEGKSQKGSVKSQAGYRACGAREGTGLPACFGGMLWWWWGAV